MRNGASDALVFAFCMVGSYYIQFNSTSKGGRIKCELFSLNIFLYIGFSVSQRTRMTNGEIRQIHFQQHFYTSLILKLMMSYIYSEYFFSSRSKYTGWNVYNVSFLKLELWQQLFTLRRINVRRHYGIVGGLWK